MPIGMRDICASATINRCACATFPALRDSLASGKNSFAACDVSCSRTMEPSFPIGKPRKRLLRQTASPPTWLSAPSHRPSFCQAHSRSPASSNRAPMTTRARPTQRVKYLQTPLPSSRAGPAQSWFPQAWLPLTSSYRNWRAISWSLLQTIVTAEPIAYSQRGATVANLMSHSSIKRTRTCSPKRCDAVRHWC